MARRPLLKWSNKRLSETTERHYWKHNLPANHLFLRWRWNHLGLTAKIGELWRIEIKHGNRIRLVGVAQTVRAPVHQTVVWVRDQPMFEKVSASKGSAAMLAIKRLTCVTPGVYLRIVQVIHTRDLPWVQSQGPTKGPKSTPQKINWNKNSNNMVITLIAKTAMNNSTKSIHVPFNLIYLSSQCKYSHGQLAPGSIGFLWILLILPPKYTAKLSDLGYEYLQMR